MAKAILYITDNPDGTISFYIVSNPPLPPLAESNEATQAQLAAVYAHSVLLSTVNRVPGEQVRFTPPPAASQN